ncbi:C39 family peptidase [Aminipila butyrica]|uniref:C39 family peptidase n=1 Tax=Aminipila butyrica TaxID=433296 RepID=A0A858BXH5_9FIRM|nr:C39 family peptidase [Aminipila butyrica]QIB69785.1 C39 family peptidase [Aminipila butyrica]
MKKDDLSALATTAFYTATGRYTSAVIHGLKNWKVIVGAVSAFIMAFIIVISLLVSMPGLIMQSILPGETYEKQLELSSFAKGEITATDTEKKNFILELLSSLSTKDESATLSSDEPSSEEILMIYTAKYGGFFDANQLDQKKIRQITNSFLTVEGLTVKVKPFSEVVNSNGLTEEQKTIAMNMYRNHMYDQTVSLTIGDSLKNYGSIIYKTGETNVVYFSQRDERWAMQSYGDGTVGAAGCGPSSLAMVVSSLTNKQINPKEMCDWAYKNGYKSKGGGSYWSLIPTGGKKFGLQVESNVQETQQLVDALSSGKLVIAIMGPGHFTSSGHFIVLRGVTENGEILVADSYSQKNTNKSWPLETIVRESKKGHAAGGPFWILSK